jgi:hypothetical protein
MGKTVMTLLLPEARVRKKTAKAVQYHKDKSKYCRKAKHKGSWADSQGPFVIQRAVKPRPSGRGVTIFSN